MKIGTLESFSCGNYWLFDPNAINSNQIKHKRLIVYFRKKYDSVSALSKCTPLTFTVIYCTEHCCFITSCFISFKVSDVALKRAVGV